MYSNLGHIMFSNASQYLSAQNPSVPHYGISALNQCGITALNHYGITALNHYGTTALNHYGITALNHYGTTVMNHYGITVLNQHGVRVFIPMVLQYRGGSCAIFVFGRNSLQEPSLDFQI